MCWSNKFVIFTRKREHFVIKMRSIVYLPTKQRSNANVHIIDCVYIPKAYSFRTSFSVFVRSFVFIFVCRILQIKTIHTKMKEKKKEIKHKIKAKLYITYLSKSLKKNICDFFPKLTWIKRANWRSHPIRWTCIFWNGFV